MARRLVVTVCPREHGAVVLPVERGRRACRLDAGAILHHLQRLIGRRSLDDRVQVREACAGGCYGAGPNVGVTIYPVPRPGERADQVAIGWKTYVYTLRSLDCLARVIDENMDEPPRAPIARRPARSAPRRRPRGC